MHRRVGDIPIEGHSVLPTDANPPEQGRSDDLPEAEVLTPDDELLARVKEVARRIVERVRKVAGDTQPDSPALSSDPTDEHPPTP
jgi:hypothetical protein